MLPESERPDPGRAVMDPTTVGIILLIVVVVVLGAIGWLAITGTLK